MTQTRHVQLKGKYSAATEPVRDTHHVPLHQFYVPNFKSKSKSQAHSHAMEFLSQVFASEGASRFFKTFLLRFLFDGGSQSSDDCSGTMALRAAR